MFAKFMILVKSNPDLEARVASMSELQFEDQMAAIEVFNDELKKAAVMQDCDGLRPSCEGRRVRFEGSSRTVVDGPFNGDLVAGYWLWELPSIEEAVAWVKRCPNPMGAPSEIEIGPIYGLAASDRRLRLASVHSNSCMLALAATVCQRTDAPQI